MADGTVTDTAETATETNANVDTANPNIGGDVSAEIASAIDAMLATSDIPDVPDDEPDKPANDLPKQEDKVAKPADAASTLPAQEAKQEDKQEAKPDANAADTDRANQRLAAREAEIANKEKALREQEKTYATLGSKLRRGEFGDVFKALGLDDREVPLVIRAAMASQLPADKRPAAYKEYAEKLAEEDRYRGMISEVASEAKSAKAELEQYKAMVAEQQAAAQYHAETEKYLSNGVAQDAPTFAKLLQADRSEAMRRLYAVVQSDAKAKLEAGSGDVMTPAEAAKAVEAELSKIATLLGTTNGTPQTKTVVKASLSNKATPAARPPSVKTDVPLEKSVDDWLVQNGLV